jgi:DNA primase
VFKGRGDQRGNHTFRESSVKVMESVSQYVDLRLTASGAVGLYSFHDDHHPSLGVNTEGNYWHCFAGGGGGSVIDFYIKWRKCDFTTAIKELAEVVL